MGSDWWKIYMECVEIKKSKDYDAIIEAWNKALEEFPDSVEFIRCRGEAWEQKGDYEAAAADYSRVIALRPDSPDGWNYRGNLRYDQKDYDNAIADYTEAIACAPEHPSYWSNRGIAYGDKGDLDAAIRDLDKAVDLDSEHSWALMHRGLNRRRRGEFDMAVRDLTMALIYTPEDAWALHQRGYCWFMLGELDKAAANFTAAIAVKPDDADLWYSRAVCYWNKHSEIEDTDRAASDFSKAIELAPDMASAYFGRGNANYHLALEKINWMKGIIMGRAEDEAGRLLLMGQLANIGYKELVPLFNSTLVAIRSNKTKFEGVFWEAADLMAKDYLRNAVEDFNRVIALKPDMADAFFRRGLCYDTMGDAGRAAADYEQARTLDPGHGRAKEKLEALRERMKAERAEG
ncbi:MAG: tetratricopeptide repeat protein [Treponema sp.]|jgi:tetratricopeptide (TPR) repeat protein|nr:tetratricopeptide repeat protein [Treponema sp.]